MNRNLSINDTQFLTLTRLVDMRIRKVTKRIANLTDPVERSEYQSELDMLQEAKKALTPEA